jgi:GT2 family glycosyltransferase
VGGFRAGHEGAQDWDLVLRLSEQVPPAHIRHIPHVLYHWRAIPGSTAKAAGEKQYIKQAQLETLRAHFCRTGRAAEVIPAAEVHWRVKYPLPQPSPPTTLIIPTRNSFDLLHRCVESIYRKTRYPNFELLIVDNQTDDPQTLEYMDWLAKERKVTVLRYDAPFNYSAINNFAVRHARGEVIGLINNDIEAISPEWLEEMVTHALRPEIGAVGALLYYPNDTIQHAGVVVGLGGVAGHIYLHSPRGYVGQQGRAVLIQNYSAVTAACLVIRRAVFEEVGGLDEVNFSIAFNDVDLCLRIREKGYRNLWTPYAELYHWESASRGYENTQEKQVRFKREMAALQQRWGAALLHDPAYNPNLTLERGDCTLAFPPRTKRPWPYGHGEGAGV